MRNKIWIFTVLTLTTLSMFFVGLTNYIVDPLWCFNHFNTLNQKQRYFDERQQKTNKLYFSATNKYDGIIIGSSRTAIINQNDFENMNLYNYSSSALTPNEYKAYIDFSKEISGKEFKTIVIGTDFFGSMNIKENQIQDPLYYINNAKSSFYRYKMLFSKSAFVNSIKNIKLSMRADRSYYDRDNIKYYPKVSESKRASTMHKNIKKRVEEFKNSFYDDKYIEYLKELKNDNKNTQFIVHTPPISAKLLTSILKNDTLMNNHERWLKEIISVFGEVHHFMSINSITSDIENYPDAEHYYPNVGKLIANKLSGIKNPNIPNDFGIILNKNNINTYITILKAEVKNHDSK